MNFNLPLILVSLVFVTGIIWLYDILVLSKPRKLRIQQLEKQFASANLADAPVKAVYDDAMQAASAEPMVVEISKSFFPVLFIVFALRSFLFEPFQIPSGSLIPTLKIGDFIVVNKFAYGLRVPVLNKTFIPIGKPQRGDVMVFFPPHQPDTYFIKRVIGLPGDKVRYTNNVLYINDVEMKQELVERVTPEARSYCYARGLQTSVMIEDIYGAKHKMQKCDEPSNLSVDGTWIVEPGHYFMMGDNRDNSADSRAWGTVSEDAIVGKAFAVWMHWESFFSIPSFENVGAIQ